eukprot:XP_001696555.1 predicted protein [Chlamydomonas reinhardtii]
MAGASLVNGKQTVPVFRLPLMIAAQRKYSYDNATLDFEVMRRDGNPGDVATAAVADAAEAAAGEDGGPISRVEDLPGVSVDAWMRVTRGLPPSDPYTPGDGFVVCVDGGRFLPANVTVTKVTLSIWNCDRRPLGVGGFYGISWPDSDSLNPRCTSCRGASACVCVCS